MKRFPADLKIETKRLILRPSIEADYPSLQKILSDLRTMKHLQWMAKRPRGWSWEDVQKRFENYRTAQTYQKLIDFIIIERKTNQVIGNCGFNRFSKPQSIGEYGIILHYPFWGLGLGSEARFGCFDYGFETLGLNSIVTQTSPENSPVVRFYEKIKLSPIYSDSTVRFELDKSKWLNFREKISIDRPRVYG